MFNYSAEQLFVIQPWATGGGMLSHLLSLDDQTAFVNFKKLSVAEKLQVWNKHVDAPSTNAHSIGFYNVNSNNHVKYIADADYCERYVHKCHFYELDGPTDFYKVDGLQDKKQISFLNNVTGSKKSIGIYLTDNCIDQLKQIRPHVPPSNCYQTWVYRNQARLLKEFYKKIKLKNYPLLIKTID